MYNYALLSLLLLLLLPVSAGSTSLSSPEITFADKITSPVSSLAMIGMPSVTYPNTPKVPSSKDRPAGQPVHCTVSQESSLDVRRT